MRVLETFSTVSRRMTGLLGNYACQARNYVISKNVEPATAPIKESSCQSTFKGLGFRLWCGTRVVGNAMNVCKGSMEMACV